MVDTGGVNVGYRYWVMLSVWSNSRIVRRDSRVPSLVPLVSMSLMVSIRSVVVVLSCDHVIEFHHKSVLFDKLRFLSFIPISLSCSLFFLLVMVVLWIA